MIPLVLLVLFLSFILLDLVFFWVNQAFLNKTIRGVQGKMSQVRVGGAILCYVALTLLMYFTLSLDYLKTFGLGAGIYAVYEGTNYAIFEKWPLQMVVMDTVWGGILFVLVKFIYQNLKKLTPLKKLMSI
jgi:uncharacterized membrane protein